jgi:hypothetical protein
MRRWDKRLLVLAWGMAALFLCGIVVVVLGLTLLEGVRTNAERQEQAICSIEQYARRQADIIESSPNVRRGAAAELRRLADNMRATGIQCRPVEAPLELPGFGLKG